MAQRDIKIAEQWIELAKQTRYDPVSLARLLHIGPRLLRQYTRELFNKSPGDWLEERRLADAAILLRSNQLIKTVASELGFKTVSDFSQKFKARYGMSPQQYKEQRQIKAYERNNDSSQSRCI